MKIEIFQENIKYTLFLFLSTKLLKKIYIRKDHRWSKHIIQISISTNVVFIIKVIQKLK